MLFLMHKALNLALQVRNQRLNAVKEDWPLDKELAYVTVRS